MKSITLKTALIAVSLLTLVMAVAVGVVSMNSLGTLNDGANTFNDDILPGYVAAEEMNVSFGDMRIAGANHIMSTSDEAEAAAEKAIDESEADFQAWAKKYEATIPA